MAERLQYGSIESYRQMGLETALAEVGNRVYAATAIMEDFENAGKAFGNGHHARQAIALNAQVELLERWREESDILELSQTHPAVVELRSRSEATT